MEKEAPPDQRLKETQSYNHQSKRLPMRFTDKLSVSISHMLDDYGWEFLVALFFASVGIIVTLFSFVLRVERLYIRYVRDDDWSASRPALINFIILVPVFMSLLFYFSKWILCFFWSFQAEDRRQWIYLTGIFTLFSAILFYIIRGVRYSVILGEAINRINLPDGIAAHQQLTSSLACLLAFGLLYVRSITAIRYQPLRKAVSLSILGICFVCMCVNAILAIEPSLLLKERPHFEGELLGIIVVVGSKTNQYDELFTTPTIIGFTVLLIMSFQEILHYCKPITLLKAITLVLVIGAGYSELDSVRNTPATVVSTLEYAFAVLALYMVFASVNSKSLPIISDPKAEMSGSGQISLFLILRVLVFFISMLIIVFLVMSPVLDESLIPERISFILALATAVIAFEPIIQRLRSKTSNTTSGQEEKL